MRLLVVTGMHRSGTSLAARILNLLGVELGPREALLDATDANPRGYWEAQAVTDLDNELLGHLGGSWHTPPPLVDGWAQDPSLDDVRRRARRLLDDLFGDADVAAFKDPRASLLLPFWRTVVPIDGTLVVLRRPAEVAESLRVRDGHHPDRAAGLWLDYVTAAWTHDPDRRTVTYEELLADPVGAAHRFADWFHLFPPTEAAQREIEEFRSHDLQRSRGVTQPDSTTLAAADSLYRMLVAAGHPAEGTVAADASPDLDQVVALVRADRAHGRALAMELHHLRTARRDRDRMAGRLDQLERDRRAATEERHRLEAAFGQRTRERDQARRDAVAWRDRHDRLRRRRGVRLALGLAAPLRPLVRWLRARRAGSAGTP